MASPPEYRGNHPISAFRVARRPYADLSGEGARRVGGRWNSPGRPALYAAESRALAVLEVLAHLDLDAQLIPADYVIMTVDFSTLDDVSGWMEDGPSLPPSDAECRAVGDAFLNSGRSLLLRLPSILVPRASNFMVNPLHPLAAHLRVAPLEPFAFDRRLLRRQ
ncbi:MAG TPA: RES family NAD+ phosphorylase [Dongiaceae bacterium]|nr:RES family NAD+ phosphorylase [Dongiaceae bacterium]